MFDILRLVDRKKAIAIISLGLISGLMNFLFLAFINLMIGLVLSGRNVSDVNYIVLFLALMLALIWSKRALSFIVIRFSQRTFWRLRSEVLHTILKASFYQFSKRKDQIHAVLVQDVNVLTNFSLWIIQFLSALIMTLGCFTYMGLQSRTLLLLTLGVSAVGVTLYSVSAHYNKKKFALGRELENSFMKSFLDILSGFKEIHMNPGIGQDIFHRKIRKISDESFVNNIRAFTGFLNVQIIGEVLFYTLIAFILIYSPLFVSESPAAIVNFVFILLFLLGSLNTIMQVIPVLVQARISSGKIYKLKTELSDERFENNQESRCISVQEFRSLTVTGLVFEYEGQGEEKNVNFCVGPLDLSLEKNEVVFIYGGNGSGKTTMINTLLGILQPSAGKISFNATELGPENYADYRTLFSVIFSDFHLFDELYGFESVSEEEINNYLELFELHEKVTFRENAFSTNNLSTGQRKRLGLIIALLRARPILVLDEWAADQDPVFRRKFYMQIIPELKNRGFSVIAITHDDAYYHVADKLYKMESGQLTSDHSKKHIIKETVT